MQWQTVGGNAYGLQEAVGISIGKCSSRVILLATVVSK
jgi:hypothetical protein